MDPLESKLLEEVQHSLVQTQLTIKLIKESFKQKNGKQVIQIKTQQDQINLLAQKVHEQQQTIAVLKKQLAEVKTKCKETIEKRRCSLLD